MPQDLNPAVKKKKVKKINPAKQECDRLASIYISDKAEDTLSDEYSSPTRQFICAVMDRKYEFSDFKEDLRNADMDHALLAKVYRYMGDEIVAELRDEAAKRRMSMQMNRSKAEQAAREEAKEKAGKSKKHRQFGKKDEAAGEGSESVQMTKMSLEAMGQEIAQREAAGAEEQRKRDEENAEMQTEQDRHNTAYQLAFQLYGDGMRLQATPEDKADTLIKHVIKMGSSVLTERQMAVDQIRLEKPVHLAVPALLSGVRDPVIAQKSIGTLGYVADHRLIPRLLGYCKEFSGDREGNLRGTAMQALGSIVQKLNTVKKGAGSIKVYELLNREAFEKDLQNLLGLFKRDAQTADIRKHYLSDDCFKWLLLVGAKLMKDKMKEVDMRLMKMKVQTPLSKSIKEVLDVLEVQLGKK